MRFSQRSRIGWLLVVVAVAGILAALAPGYTAQAQMPSKLSPNATVFATGLDNPRGLAFGPGGALYVAEGGQGGTTTTVGMCTQVVEPIGPYLGGGKTGRISKISSDGTRTTVAGGLPSSQTAAAAGSLVSGVSDIEFLGGTLYALLAGAGCSHGVADMPNAVLRVNADGSTTQVADLSAFLMAHPVAHPEEEDFEPDGTPYSMVHVGSDLYVVEPNHGELDRVSLDGTISRVVDVSASQGHVVPTSVAVGPDGNFYIGNLGTFPVTQGTQHIYRVTPDGNLNVFASGLTAVLGVAFDRIGRLYVLEMSAGVTGPGAPFVPGTGRVLRLTGSTSETVASGLTFPTAMAFGPDGYLYVSNNGFLFPPGGGEIVRVDVNMPAAPSGICPQAGLPQSVIDQAMANPQSFAGWGRLMNPNVPFGPTNPFRSWLGVRNPSLDYSPIGNRAIWKVGCP